MPPLLLQPLPGASLRFLQASQTNSSTASVAGDDLSSYKSILVAFIFAIGIIMPLLFCVYTSYIARAFPSPPPPQSKI